MKQLLLLSAIFLFAIGADAQRRGGGYGHSSYHPAFRGGGGFYGRGYDRPFYRGGYGFRPGYGYGGFAYHRPFYGPYYPYYRPYVGVGIGFGVGLGVGLGYGYPYVPPMMAPAMSYNYAPAYASAEPQEAYSTPPPAPVPPVNTSTSSMSSTDFERAKSSIYAKSSDNSKLTIAEEIANSNYLTSSQVREMMGLLNAEGARLDFAKYAYPHTIDTNNYYMVNDALSSESSINELNNYINRR